MDRGGLDREPAETWCLQVAPGRNGLEGSLATLIPRPLARKRGKISLSLPYYQWPSNGGATALHSHWEVMGL